jgi:hypothetical protein
MAPGALLLRVASLLALAAAMVLGPSMIEDQGLGRVFLWFAVLMYLMLAPLIWSRKPDLFQPPVITGITSCFGAIAMLVNMLDAGEVKTDLVKAIDADQSAELAVMTVQAMMLGLCSYYAGYYAKWGKRFKNAFPKVAGLTWDPWRIALISLPVVIAFAAAYWVFQTRLGVSIFDATQLAEGKSVWREDPTLSWMLRGIELGFIPALLFFTWSASRKGWATLILPVLGVIVLAFLVSRIGQRGMFAFVLICLTALFHYLRRRIPVLALVAFYFVGIAVSNQLGEWRVAASTEDRTLEIESRVADPTGVLSAHEGERQRFAALTLVMNEFPDHHPYLVGESWLAVFALPIPRWLWPEKVDNFYWQDNRIVLRLSGTPAPTPYVGTLYANFSWLGIVVGMLLFGVFHRSLYEWLQQSPADRNVVLLYILIVIYFAPTMLNLSFVMQYVVPTWLMIRLIGRRPKPQPASESASAATTTS